ncbi:MAG: LysE family transporter [Desulfobacterales bacterium]|nr:LysE family transporter [Desulfobacterales bacterium]
MEPGIFLKGFIIGISIAAPVGPIGVLCIQRTLSGGNIHGLVSGLGAATADAIYGFIAAFGLTFISNFIVEQQTWFRIIGGLFLCYLGIRAFMSKPSEQAASVNKYSNFGAYGTTFLLTLTNPMTILSFAAIFAGLGIISKTVHYFSASLLVIGVFMGSALWWFILSGSASLFRSKLTSARLAWLNRISGIIILTFGLFALLL